MPTDDELFDSLVGSSASDADDDDDDGPASIVERSTQECTQWQIGGHRTYRPALATIQELPAGAYSADSDKNGYYLEYKPLLTDKITELPDSANVTVLAAIQRFWKSRPLYAKHGLLFKRGILLWGPPGSGKTVTLNLLIRDIVQQNGVVLYCGHPVVLMALLGNVRQIEPNRPLIVVFEDIDELIKQYGEHAILAMLDGESQTDNCVYVATTNYIERLQARIANRPSRFDERILVGMPSYLTRHAYLTLTTTSDNTTSDVIDQWARDTEGLSIAHLRELVASVMCLGQDYSVVLKRLKTMGVRPKDVDGFREKKMDGFAPISGKD